MCIRDRYQRRVHGEKEIQKALMRTAVALALLSLVAVLNAQVTHVFTYGNGKGQFFNARTKKTYYAYSGDQSHYNRQEYQSLRAQGPIPVGKWKVVETNEYHPYLGYQAHWIEPVAVSRNYGRSEFFVHGDNSRQNHTASAGCIIVENEARENIRRGDFVVVKTF
eukprot:TRINITY_DN304_c0_g1_i5.p1 TRINITY_DN304_c0_g1~~TRINITY_DN304_c0_g1_i5.p1  ORF type:complete len:189 (+),score=61.51 TRINITY_DN304_c0_g1_i5:73-567(+)